ncbi:hypothetical protein B0H14DRAFT_3858440 [Mycena olivaceomarginata]|nr:hypothetical protein B0H14DRAFT_3858440 [Mycena olivaceomarginata]
MLHSPRNEFSAWVCIDGEKAPEYDVKISEDGRTVTCWIASELGKEFSVHWTNSSFAGCTAGQVRMDGAECGGKVIYGNVLPFTAVLNGFTDGATLRKFMFSSLGLTDDDAYLGGAALPDLGVIELYIFPAALAVAPPVGAGPALSALKVHERSKKAVTQQITLGQTEQLAAPMAVFTAAPVGPNIVKFLFKYRPIDILRANGIAPQPARAQPPPASVKRAGVRASKENEPLVKKDSRLKGKGNAKKRVKREDDDAIDLTQASPAPRRKRVKLAGFVQGEVIDLT